MLNANILQASHAKMEGIKYSETNTFICFSFKHSLLLKAKITVIELLKNIVSYTSHAIARSLLREVPSFSKPLFTNATTLSIESNAVQTC